MGSLNTYYHLAQGESLRVLREHLIREEEARRAMFAWRDGVCADHGLSGNAEDVQIVTLNGRPSGLRVNSDAARAAFTAWRAVRENSAEEDLYVPALRTNAGKALGAAMGTLAPLPRLSDLCEALYGRARLLPTGSGGFTMDQVGYEKLGDEWVLQSFHAEPPMDAVALKMSEYWLRKEAAEEAALAAAG